MKITTSTLTRITASGVPCLKVSNGKLVSNPAGNPKAYRGVTISATIADGRIETSGMDWYYEQYDPSSIAKFFMEVAKHVPIAPQDVEDSEE